MRTLIPLALAALLSVAPAMAQDDAQAACPDGQVETPEGCSQQAWVDDCPPGHMCAAGADDPHAYGDEDCIECSGPVDEPIHYGEDDCIDCTGAPVDSPTCMDGADDGEVCLEGVQYIGGPGTVDQQADTDSDAESDAGDKDAPAMPAVLLLGMLGVVVLAVRRT